MNSNKGRKKVAAVSDDIDDEYSDDVDEFEPPIQETKTLKNIDEGKSKGRQV